MYVLRMCVYRYTCIHMYICMDVCTGLGNETGKLQNIKKKSTHEFFICLLAIKEKLMNSHFVLCQFENSCFEINALKMASVSDFSQTPLSPSQFSLEFAQIFYCHLFS